jgi:hypothetical protein
MLLLHAFSDPDSAADARVEAGFPGSLRPYKGAVDPANYREVMEGAAGAGAEACCATSGTTDEPPPRADGSSRGFGSRASGVGRSDCRQPRFDTSAPTLRSQG